MWVATQKLPRSPRHTFYERLNQVLEKAGLDAFVRGRCERFFAARIGRPSLRPGRYFRVLVVGYFKRLNSERAIAWRVTDSMSLRAFLDLDPEETPPNHSTLSCTQRRIDREKVCRLAGGENLVHAQLDPLAVGAGKKRDHFPQQRQQRLLLR